MQLVNIKKSCLLYMKIRIWILHLFSWLLAVGQTNNLLIRYIIWISLQYCHSNGHLKQNNILYLPLQVLLSLFNWYPIEQKHSATLFSTVQPNSQLAWLQSVIFMFGSEIKIKHNSIISYKSHNSYIQIQKIFTFELIIFIVGLLLSK
jgi:hypothetical protein